MMTMIMRQNLLFKEENSIVYENIYKFSKNTAYTFKNTYTYVILIYMCIVLLSFDCLYMKNVFYYELLRILLTKQIRVY